MENQSPQTSISISDVISAGGFHNSAVTYVCDAVSLSRNLFRYFLLLSPATDFHFYCFIVLFRGQITKQNDSAYFLSFCGRSVPPKGNELRWKTLFKFTSTTFYKKMKSKETIYARKAQSFSEPKQTKPEHSYRLRTNSANYSIVLNNYVTSTCIPKHIKYNVWQNKLLSTLFRRFSDFLMHLVLTNELWRGFG